MQCMECVGNCFVMHQLFLIHWENDHTVLIVVATYHKQTIPSHPERKLKLSVGGGRVNHFSELLEGS